MKNLPSNNLMNRAAASARHQEKLTETMLFLLYFHASTPQIIANLLGSTDAHARQFMENLERKKLIRCLRGVRHTPFSPSGRLWLLTESGVHLAEKSLQSAPHYYPTTLDSVRTSQTEHDLMAQYLTATWVRAGAKIVSSDVFERQKNKLSRLGKLHDAVVTYRAQRLAIEYERTSKNEVEMDQTILRCAENTEIDHCVWVIENLHRKEFWCRAIAQIQVCEWTRTALNRWVKVNTFRQNSDAGKAGMTWIPLSARLKFHVFFIDDVINLEADAQLEMLLNSSRNRLTAVLATWQKSWAWGELQEMSPNTTSASLRNQYQGFLVCRQPDGWILQNEDDRSSEFRLGFAHLMATPGELPPLDVMDRAIFLASSWKNAR